MKALVLLSGGVDSSTCLALAKEKYGDEVLALSMSYGQKHSREVESARAIAAYYKVQLLEMDLSQILRIAIAACSRAPPRPCPILPMPSSSRSVRVRQLLPMFPLEMDCFWQRQPALRLNMAAG